MLLHLLSGSMILCDAVNATSILASVRCSTVETEEEKSEGRFHFYFQALVSATTEFGRYVLSVTTSRIGTT